jgi:hypothetical protein
MEEADGVPTATARTRTVDVHRFGAAVVLLEVHLGHYREVFFVVTGDKSVSITMLDENDATHQEAQVFVFAKPYQWDLNGLDDDEVLLQVWQAVGVSR